MNAMKIRNLFILTILFLAACSGEGSTSATEGVPAPTLLSPQVSITRAPDVQEFATGWLDAWQRFDYETMYDSLSQLSQEAVTKDAFKGIYADTAINTALQRLDYEILATLTNPSDAQVAYRLIFHSALMDDMQRDMVMNLALEKGQWKVRWDHGLILPELQGGNHLAIDLSVPARGNIYDNEGNAIVAQAQAYALGIVPGKINSPGTLIGELMQLTGKSADAIYDLYKDANDDWYVPVADVPARMVDERYRILSQVGGLVMTPYESRYYFYEGVAPQTIGYAMAIPAEEIEEYRRKGYRGDEKVGMAGLEKWSDTDLSGKRGADLYVVDQNGQIVTRLMHTDPGPAKSIYTTIETNLQVQAQEALSGFRGAIVVLERDTGRVLAMVSSPALNPNLFDPGNANRDQLLQEQLNDGEQRLLNRATQGGYPLGSVFKIVTMAAALESGFYTEETTYNCGSDFRELPDTVLYDWTYDKDLPPSGLLTLPEGLMRSCNPYFWHIGLDLYRRNLTTAVSDMARGFGLGKATGIGQVAEDTGNISDPKNEGDAVQIAIGQGTMLVTPLQVAVFTAALGNGGALYRPQVIEKVVDANGVSTYSFQPQVNGTLPVSPENLQIIREAMYSVVAKPRGTAYKYFLGVGVPFYGKTGTAQNPLGNAHAWFAGYTDSITKEKPDIAIVVIAENAGEGSEIGAPIFRRIMEIYYGGEPKTRYPWETRVNVTQTPTPLNAGTPAP